MSRLAAQRVRTKLHKTLGMIDDVNLLRALWNVDALQSEGTRAPLSKFVSPPSAHNAAIGDQLFLYKWELETLFNESLCAPKRLQGRRQLDHQNFNTVANLGNLLRRLENSEYARRRSPENILREMGRIAQRQFEWQQEFPMREDIARSIFIYGGDASINWLEVQLGISFTDYLSSGFGLWAIFCNKPSVSLPLTVPELGLTEDSFSRTIQRISLPLSDLRAAAKRIRSNSNLETAYKPSVLRTFPLVRNEGMVLCPLAKLSARRTFEGLFYDFCDAGGEVKNEIGHRFEQYCLQRLEVAFPEPQWEGEHQYHVGKNRFDSPDLMAVAQGNVGLIAECKTRRMGHQARFGVSELPPGSEDIAKGVFQVWRYVSHVRRGFVEGKSIGEDCVGVVLTLDPWQIWSAERAQRTYLKANEIAELAGHIIDEDRIPVALCSMRDFEPLLQDASYPAFCDVLKKSVGEERLGWNLRTLFESDYPDEQLGRPYPFEDLITERLPWWNEIG